ncbi:1132_t:CDS:2 [Acaulospora colombiana]|uniref:1132_t:CDS:1 n=1 Tax=Acaulospora colombiana TaxID=27376 RepID=A0ACA9KMI3_9GLOM|nr:1132_t:CDS:2 [Acaulospora colombiana]
MTEYSNSVLSGLHPISGALVISGFNGRSYNDHISLLKSLVFAVLKGIDYKIPSDVASIHGTHR